MNQGTAAIKPPGVREGFMVGSGLSGVDNGETERKRSWKGRLGQVEKSLEHHAKEPALLGMYPGEIL